MKLTVTFDVPAKDLQVHEEKNTLDQYKKIIVARKLSSYLAAQSKPKLTAKDMPDGSIRFEGSLILIDSGQVKALDELLANILSSHDLVDCRESIKQIINLLNGSE